MKVQVKWFLTGKISSFEEADDILGPQTSIAELKGLIQIRFGFHVSEIVLIKDHLLENDSTLEKIGLVGSPKDPILTAHVIRESELEPSNIKSETSIEEYSHTDFILAMKMLGKPVPITDERLLAMRMNAPRQRPSFLNVPERHMAHRGSGGIRQAGDNSSFSLQRPDFHPMPGSKAASSPSPSTQEVSQNRNDGEDSSLRYNPRATQVYKIFENVLYGLRREGVDEEFQLPYPGMDPLSFWDARVPDPSLQYERECEANEICLELFYFGEFKAVKDHQKLIALVHQTIDSKAGVRVRVPCRLREAGCMYPLIAVPIVLSEVDALVLGDRFFEDFGKRRNPKMEAKGTHDPKEAGAKNATCAPQ